MAIWRTIAPQKRTLPPPAKSEFPMESRTNMCPNLSSMRTETTNQRTRSSKHHQSRRIVHKKHLQKVKWVDLEFWVKTTSRRVIKMIGRTLGIQL